mgnify:CR=1 FL=1
MDPLILEAIARRAPGGSLAGGTTLPAGQQVSQPTGATPTGGPNTPQTPPPAAPQAPVPNAQVGKQVGGAVKSAQAVNGPNFDDDTRRISKALISNLIKYL